VASKVDVDLFGVEIPNVCNPRSRIAYAEIPTSPPARSFVYNGRTYGAREWVELWGAGADAIGLLSVEDRRRLEDAFARRIFAPAPIPRPLETPRAPLVSVAGVMSDRFARALEAAEIRQAAKRAEIELEAGSVQLDGKGPGSDGIAPPEAPTAVPRWLAIPEPVVEHKGAKREIARLPKAYANDAAAAAAFAALSALTRIEFPDDAKALDIRQLRATVKNACRRLHKRNSNLRKCGIRRFTGSVEIREKRLSAPAGSAYLAPAGAPTRVNAAGLIRCASVHACVTCAPAISSQRAKIVTAVVEAHRARSRSAADPGGGVYMLTLTVPHEYGMPARPLRRNVSLAWKNFQQGKSWPKLKTEMGFVGSITSRETTHGENGFHPHLHILIATERPLGDVERHNLEVTLFRRWLESIERVNKKVKRSSDRIDVPDWEHGISLEQCRQADYIQKLGLADELTRGDAKKARGKNRTPFQIMADYARKGSPRDAEIIREYVRAFKGARQLTWSRSRDGSTDLRQIYADAIAALEPIDEQPTLDGFESDETIARLVDESGGVPIVAIAGRRWDALVRVMRSAGFDTEWQAVAAGERARGAGVDELFDRAAVIGVALLPDRPHLRKWLPWLAATPPADGTRRVRKPGRTPAG
jgi:hypothetical protein